MASPAIWKATTYLLTPSPRLVDALVMWWGCTWNLPDHALVPSSVQELEKAIYEYLAAWNEAPKPFVWKATADSILEKVKRCEESNVTEH